MSILIPSQKENSSTKEANSIFYSINRFIKKNVVLVIAISAAILTMFFVPPDNRYASYFDWKTLSCLFSVLAVVCALKNIHFFTILAYKTVQCFKKTRYVIIALQYITFVGSMLIANDMALLTFLPLGFFVLTSTGNERYMAFTFIMQNISANLGGMLTPFGNPQNLYLYSKFNIPTGEFVLIMLPLFLAAIFLITVCCMFIKNEPLVLKKDCGYALNRKRAVLYLLLFSLSIVIVFSWIPYYVGLAIILISLLFLDRGALKKVDYPLLLTFFCFFIFSGNLSRIEAVHRLISQILEINTLIFSTLSCQFISNVPSAILLSQFTDQYRELLMGVNIGGTGTLIASLASLITFREYNKHNPGKTGYYLGLFSAFNFGFLILLTALALIL